jgi:Glycerophosphoryl diester phosphodiesterase
VAHRGGALRAPENTIEAMELGVSHGADALEFDVRLSADGEVVVIHDPRVDRTTDGTGEVAQMTLSELRALNASSRKQPEPWSGTFRDSTGIPTLHEVLSRFPGLPLIIEVKAPVASARTRLLIEQHGATKRCIVASFDPSAMRAFRGSGIARGATRNQALFVLATGHSGAVIEGGFEALFTPFEYHGIRVPIRRMVLPLRRAGKPTHVWTINDREQARRLWQMGVCGIVSDDVLGMVAARKGLQDAPGPA